MRCGPFATLDAALDPTRHGTKACALARARAAGLPVPDGFVIGAEHCAPTETHLPPALEAPLEDALRALGSGPWVVRTSAPTEDLPGASAAGLYLSELGLREARAVGAAVARCWAASRAPSVRVYLEPLGLSPPPVAVLVQRQQEARWGGVLFTRDPRDGPDGDHLLCELVPGSTTRVTAGLAEPTLRRLPWGAVATPPRSARPSWAEALVELAPRLEQVVGGPADAELAIDADDRVWLLQLRPITAYAERAARPDRPDDGLTWTWDAEHNPAPLSPLHASLVAHLDGLGTLPFRLQTVEGYLYTAPRSGRRGAEDAIPDAAGWPSHRRRLTRRAEALEQLQRDDAPLDALLEAFDRFYGEYAELAGAPLSASHRRWADTLDEELRRGALHRGDLSRRLRGVATPLTRGLRHLADLAAGSPEVLAALEQGRAPAGSPAAAAFDGAFAALSAEVGALAPAWDVAVPTLGEEPARLRRTVAALARGGLAGLPDAGSGGDPADDGYRTALQADEEDDLLFARALAALRRAFLGVGRQLVERGALARAEDVFWLDLERLGEACAADGAAGDLRARVRELQGVAPASAAPPRVLRGGVGLDAAPHGDGERLLRGVGCGGGTARAQALVLTDLGAAPDEAVRGRIVVCAALLPSSVPWLVDAAGVVTDHGGLLSHGAILARELGLPAVLGTRVATRRIASGQLLWVDADRGVVIRIEGKRLSP